MLTDDSKLMMCKECCEKHGKVELPWAEIDIKGSADIICPECGKPMTQTNLINKESKIMCRVSTDTAFTKAMMDLKDNDIIEFNLKLSQFETQFRQEQKVQFEKFYKDLQAEIDAIKCPYCKSTDVQKISATSRAGSAIMFGIFSKKIGKQWHCNNCKSDF